MPDTLDPTEGIPVTITSTISPVPALAIMPSHGASLVEHILPVPIGMCPRSKNPLSGTLTLRYVPRAHAIEIVSLTKLVATIHRSEGGPRSSEGWARAIADLVAKALPGVEITYLMELVVAPGPQQLRVTGKACSYS